MECAVKLQAIQIYISNKLSPNQTLYMKCQVYFRKFTVDTKNNIHMYIYFTHQQKQCQMILDLKQVAIGHVSSVWCFLVTILTLTAPRKWDEKVLKQAHSSKWEWVSCKYFSYFSKKTLFVGTDIKKHLAEVLLISTTMCAFVEKQ